MTGCMSSASSVRLEGYFPFNIPLFELYTKRLHFKVSNVPLYNQNLIRGDAWKWFGNDVTITRPPSPSTTTPKSHRSENNRNIQLRFHCALHFDSGVHSRPTWLGVWSQDYEKMENRIEIYCHPSSPGSVGLCVGQWTILMVLINIPQTTTCTACSRGA